LAKIFDDAVNGWSRTAIASFNPIGTPSSGPRASPTARRASAAVACTNASLAFHELNARTCGSIASMRARQARVSSTAETLPSASAAESSARV
jgi:hypothetical protein